MKLKKRLIALCTSAVMMATVAVPATSPAVIDAATAYVNYAKALQYSLYMFDANMCGTDVNENSDLNWRGDCHTDDANRQVNINGQNYTVDVSGGYHDAGDHIKFALPAGQAMSTLNLAYLKFGGAFDSIGEADHLQKILEREADYLSRCIVRDNSGKMVGFVVQVGDNTSDQEGNADHRSLVAPEQQGSTKRDLAVASSSNPCSDEVYVSAAVLAGVYKNFGNSEYLDAAMDLWNFAESNGKAIRNCPFYGSSDWEDDRALASAWLSETSSTGVSYQAVADDWVPNWDNTGAFASAVKGSTSGIGQWATPKSTAGGFDFYDQWGSLRLLCNIQFVKACAGQDMAKTQQTMDFIFGNNQRNICFQVGYASNSVKNPHHRAAAPGMSSVQNVLVGAMVGGPESGDANFAYTDEVGNYVGNEVALDYQAGFVGCLAALVSNYGSSDKPVDPSTIPGTRGLYSAEGGGGNPDPTPTTTKSGGNATTTTKGGGSSTGGNGETVVQPNEVITWNGEGQNGELIIPLSELMGTTDTLTKIEVDVNASKALQFSGALAVSAEENNSSLYDEEWTAFVQRIEEIQPNGEAWAIPLTRGTNTLEIEIPSAYRQYVNPYGDFQIQFWYSDAVGNSVTVEEVRAYTTGGGSVTPTPTTTKAATTTARTTTKAPTTTTKSGGTSSGENTVNPNEVITWNGEGQNGELIIPLSELMGVNDTLTKIEVDVYASKALQFSGALSVSAEENSSSLYEEDWLAFVQRIEEIQPNGESWAIPLTRGTNTLTITIPSSYRQYVNPYGDFQIQFWYSDAVGNSVTVEEVRATVQKAAEPTPTTTKATTTKATTTKKATTTTKATTTKTVTTTKATTKAPVQDVTEYGDIDRDGKLCDITDVVLLGKHISGKLTLPSTSQNYKNCNVNQSGSSANSVDVDDLKTVIDVMLGVDISIPVK